MEEVDIERVKSFWLEFNLDDRRTGLDRQCLEMRELKGMSTGGRKRLNELTRSFRSKSKEDQLVQMTELLKAYQEEIDQLSKRAKFAESSFFSLYKAVYEAPDPYPVFEQLTSAVSNSLMYPLEIERLKGEIAQYDIEFQQLKNQDITIRRLEEQLEEYKTNVEEKVQKEIAKYSIEIEEHAEQKVRDIIELQKAAERRLTGAVEAMKQAQASAERAQSQLFEVSAQADNRFTALQTDNAMLIESAERAHARCAELEGEVENLKNTILILQQNGGSKNTSSEIMSLPSEEVETLQLVINDLRNEIKKKDDNSRLEKSKLEASLREANQQISKERDILILTRKELAERPTKEDLINARKQLKILQSIAFNVVAEDENEADPENTLGDNMQLETLLTSRIKSLETELSEARKDLRDIQQKFNESKIVISDLTTNYEKAKILISRLEADLESQISNPNSKNKVIDTNKINKQQHELDLSRLLGVDEAKNLNEDRDATDKNSNQITSILQAQRDRYKERLAQAESASVDLNQQLDLIKSKVVRLEEDNLALYAKIRYLHSYHGSNTSTIGRNNFTNSNTRNDRYYDEERGVNMYNQYSVNNTDLGDDIEKRYHSIYEKKMNPFAEFSEFEKQRKLRELTVADRIVLNTLQTVINNHTGRNFLIIYAGSMHLFVFLILYYNVHYVHRGCDTIH